MRQHVNPLSKNFDEIEKIPSLIEMFDDSKLNLHLDIGCAAGEYLFDLALENTNWNYLGIEIRERLVNASKLKVRDKEIKNSNLPDELRIGAVLRDKKIIIPRSNFVFKKDDRVVFIVKKDSISFVENIFRLSSV